MIEFERLRQELMGREYRAMIKAALTVCFSDSPEARLAAMESLRDDVQRNTPA